MLSTPFSIELPLALPPAAIDADWSVRQAAMFVAGALLALSFARTLQDSLWGVKAPVVGQRSVWEPRFLVGMRFIRGSTPMIRDGYAKFKDTMFKVRRNDGYILIISNKHVDQLRNLPDDTVSAIGAHVKNLLGRYSTTSILLESDLHTRVLQRKLTPMLGSTIPVVKDELDFALKVEVPECRDWVSVQLNDILLRIVARISARIFIGAPACRNEEWLATSIDYTTNVFTTIMILRMAPPFLHPLLALFLPSYWRVHSNLRTAKRIISPMVRERRGKQSDIKIDKKRDEKTRDSDKVDAQADKAGAGGDDGETAPPIQDLLQWMMEASDAATDGQPDKLAHRQLLLSLASIHTTTMAAAHAMYDLCAHPEFVAPLRAEITSVLREDGGWQKASLNKMRRLDSFLKESQRFNPPSQMAFNRVVRRPVELSDGTVLPRGTHFSMASDAIMQDPAHVAGGGDPAVFDPFRYARLREDPARPENIQRFQFAMTDSSNLHFGHGKFSCPGRFFASNEIKMILAHLLLCYDMRYPDGHGRPRNLTADENIYPDPAARILIRKREITEEGIRPFFPA